MISDDEYNQGLLSTEAELTLDVFGNLMPSDAPPVTKSPPKPPGAAGSASTTSRSSAG